MQYHKEVGQEPVFDGAVLTKPSRRAPTLHKDRKHLCQLQLKAQPANNHVANRDQKWTPREKYKENANVA